MPSTIPYDPSLVLGNIVEPEALTNLLAISAEQAPIDAAEEKMNSFISMKRSLDMTIQELTNMGIQPDELLKNDQTVKDSISKAAIDYAKIRLAQEQKIQDLKSKLQVVHSNIESPIDYNKTAIKNMPLSADSLKMDCQYFSYESNEQDAQNTVASVKSFVSGSIGGVFTPTVTTNASTSVASQINQQRENHDIAGTLIISVTCTHKQTSLLAPFVLDVDKAIRVWNSMFKDNKDKLKTDDKASMARAAAEEGTDKEQSLSILSGATYGSCFIGMVHVLNHQSTTSSQSMTSVASSLQAQAEENSWLEDIKGGFGVSASFANDVKNMLSRQDVSSHMNLVVMGIIPSIKSNQLQMGVKQFTEFSPDAMMGKLATLANATSGSDGNTETKSIASAAASARTGGQMVALEGATITNAMSGLADIDKTANSILDTNSMMTSFEDYVTKAGAGDIGIPINYYLKRITKSQLAKMWVGKYYPELNVRTSGDDTGAPGAAAGTGAAPSGDSSS